MFNTPFNQNNSIFSSPIQQNSEDRLNQLYHEMELAKSLQNKNTIGQKTVFTDIAEEMKNISEDEKKFIESSKEYIAASEQYQNDFSMFLIDTFGAEFTRSKYSKSAENVLAVIKGKKDEYKNHFADNINEIREQNNNLAKQNDYLAKTNKELQKQLELIQKQLGGLKNEDSE